VRCSYEDIAESFPAVIRHTEQPIVRTSPAPLFLLARLVRENGYKVVLTGEGADETMGGYDIFKEAKIRRFWGRNPASTRRPLLLKRLYPYMQEMQRQSPAYLKRFFHVTTEDLANPFFSHLPRWAVTARLKGFLSDAVRAELSSCNALCDLEHSVPRSFGSWDPANQAEYLEAKYLLPGFILSSQGDRMAMAHAVEGRYPFLDHRVVEFAAALPPRLKMKVLDQKHLLKQAAHGLVPESIRKRPKQPYRAPDGKSFLGPAGRYVDALLSPDTVRRQGIFDPRAVGALLAKFTSGRGTGTADNMAFVAILSTGLLLDEFLTRDESTPTNRTH
jgi:asparagine synthase (glutamine-hydrolysing)